MGKIYTDHRALSKEVLDSNHKSKDKSSTLEENKKKATNFTVVEDIFISNQDDNVDSSKNQRKNVFFSFIIRLFEKIKILLMNRTTKSSIENLNDALDTMKHKQDFAKMTENVITEEIKEADTLSKEDLFIQLNTDLNRSELIRINDVEMTKYMPIEKKKEILDTFIENIESTKLLATINFLLSQSIGNTTIQYLLSSDKLAFYELGTSLLNNPIIYYAVDEVEKGKTWIFNVDIKMKQDEQSLKKSREFAEINSESSDKRFSTNVLNFYSSARLKMTFKYENEQLKVLSINASGQEEKINM